jgi:hypothetical protein
MAVKHTPQGKPSPINGEGLCGMVSLTEGEEKGIQQNWGKVEELLPDFERVF